MSAENEKVSFDQDSIDRFYTQLSRHYSANDSRQSGYQFEWWFRRVTSLIRSALRAHDTTQGVVADLGCGSGLFLETVFPDHGFRVGIDLNNTACERLAQRGIKALRANIFDLPIRKKSISTLCCINVIQQFPQENTAHLIQSSAKVVADEGLMLVIWRNDSCLLHKVAKFLLRYSDKRNSLLNLYGHSLSFVTELLSEQGFNVLDCGCLAPAIGKSIGADSVLNYFFGTEFFLIARKAKS